MKKWVDLRSFIHKTNSISICFVELRFCLAAAAALVNRSSTLIQSNWFIHYCFQQPFTNQFQVEWSWLRSLSSSAASFIWSIGVVCWRSLFLAEPLAVPPPITHQSLSQPTPISLHSLRSSPAVKPINEINWIMAGAALPAAFINSISFPIRKRKEKWIDWIADGLPL